MAQANSNNSITASVDPTRRRFLSQAAGVAAGGTVLALVPRDNQGETAASIRMRMRRGWPDGARA